jgi:hypothetical protein
MISSTLATMSDKLRRAAGRRAYAEVQRLVVSLGAAAAAEARGFPPGDARIREIAAWLHEQLDWTGIMLRTARAAQADELRRIPFLKGYLRRQVQAGPRIHLDL